MLTVKGVKSSCFLLSNLFLVLVLFASPSRASSNSNYLDQAPFASSGAKKVDLALYYESLCPYCADFIANKLVNVFSKGLISIVNLKLVPWGNAVVAQNGAVVCQHGPNECKLNTVEACVIKIWPDVYKHFNYIHCIERLLVERSNKDVKSCFGTTGDWNSVQNCYNTGVGSQLELQYKAETDRLKPPHEYVPWVVVNNVPIKDGYENFIKYVCKAYKGPLPDACKSPTQEYDSAEKEKKANQVCYAAEKGTSQHKILGRRMNIKT